MPLQATGDSQVAAFHDKSMSNQWSTVICFQHGVLRAASTMMNRDISPTSPCSCTSPTAVAFLDPIWLSPNKPCYTTKWMLSLIFSLLVNASGQNNLQDKKTKSVWGYALWSKRDWDSLPLALPRLFPP
jgi:hypothetical protein